MNFTDPTNLPHLESPQTILLVDDEAPIRLLASHILMQAGFEVVIACDGIDALRQLARRPDVHLLLTDVSMPGFSGVELVRRVRVSHPSLPVLYVSGFLDCFPDACPDVPSLSKPFTSEELIGAVMRALRHVPSPAPAPTLPGGSPFAEIRA